MATEVNKLTNVYVGDFGDPISITLVDEDGNAVDVSAYTGTISVTFLSPDELKSVTKTGTFVTDGTEGKISFTFSDGDIDRDGDWKGQVKLTISTTAETRSHVFVMTVGRSLVS